MEKPLTLTEHLQELRLRLIISLSSFILASISCYFFSTQILNFLSKPAGALIFTGPLDAFMIRIKICFFVGFLISSPIIFYQLWSFVEPALNKTEKKYAFPFVFFATFLFALGLLFTYFILPVALKFLLGFGGDRLIPFLAADKYLSFLLMIAFIFGLAFEFPLVFFFLMKFNIIPPQYARQNRKYFYLMIFVAAAIITPTQDVLTMTALGIPLILFYEATLFFFRS
jgi:sec-independent protein translocase protein TatC